MNILGVMAAKVRKILMDLFSSTVDSPVDTVRGSFVNLPNETKASNGGFRKNKGRATVIRWAAKDGSKAQFL